MDEAAAFGIYWFMVIIICRQDLFQAYRLSSSLFSIFGLKKRNTKIGLEKYILFLVTDRLDSNLSWNHVYQKIISYITIPSMVNMIHYINNYCQLKHGPPSLHPII